MGESSKRKSKLDFLLKDSPLDRIIRELSSKTEECIDQAQNCCGGGGGGKCCSSSMCSPCGSGGPIMGPGCLPCAPMGTATLCCSARCIQASCGTNKCGGMNSGGQGGCCSPLSACCRSRCRRGGNCC